MCMAIPPASAHSTPSFSACALIIAAAFKPSSVVKSRFAIALLYLFISSSWLISLQLSFPLRLDALIDLGELDQELLQRRVVFILIHLRLAGLEAFDLAFKAQALGEEFREFLIAAGLLQRQGIEVGRPGERPVALVGLRVSNAVAVVVEQRVFGGHEALLFVVVVSQLRRVIEGFKRRYAAVLVGVGLGIAERGDEVFGEARSVLLHSAASRRDDDSPRA